MHYLRIGPSLLGLFFVFMNFLLIIISLSFIFLVLIIFPLIISFIAQKNKNKINDD